jgi:LuxR family maltose regulon positive regulatory protein
LRDPLLRTKLCVPRTGDGLIIRPPLNQWLTEGARRRLTLVCAPAGFGKTTLLAQWARASGMPVAWLTLDEGDDDPARFWRYFAAALRTLGGDAVEDASPLLMSGVRVEEAVLDLLINDLVEGSEDRVLIVDDYHLIRSGEIHRGLSYVVEHLPDTLHLVLAGRTVPPWRLSRLRGRGQVTELGAADLRFAPDEVGAFLTRTMRLELSPEEVDALAASTEGWVAGLQLEALSWRSRADYWRRLGGLTGADREVFDYLSEEVLGGQPKSVREFMMRTSITDRLDGSLCEVLTGHEDGQETLEGLERANLFVFPVDEERRYYRYHQLFARFLRQRLQREHPEEVQELHLKAAGWYRRNDHPVEAVRHSLRGRDFETAVDLLESVGEGMLERGEVATLLEWLEAMPGEVVDSRARLALLRAWALAHSGRLEVVDSVLRRVEGHLSAANGSTDGDSAVRTEKVVDKTLGLRGEVAAVRARVAAINEDARAVTEFSREALLWLPRENLRLRGNVALDMAHGYNLTGEVREADAAFAEAAAASEAAGNLRSTLIALWYRSSVKAVLGRLDEAAELAEGCLEVAQKEQNRETPVSGTAHVAVAQVLYERDELDDAERFFEEGVRRGKRGGEVKIVTAGYIGLARLAMARGRNEDALELMRRARRLASWPHIGAWQARVHLAAGNVAAAARWGNEYGAEHEDPYPRDLERLTSARILLARNETDAALALLERLLAKAESQGRVSHAIEALLLSALARETLGETDDATSAALRAASLAEAGGFRRILVDEGAPLATLLAKAIRRLRWKSGIEHGDASVRYLGEIVETIRVGAAAQGHHDSEKVPSASEPLTEREREVLRLVAAGLSNGQIADELYLALGTVKSHIHHIYGKLLVSSRTQAVERARELDLLG